uniref:Uncharacterized protein n=1 Tax=Rhizophora mucronata TaxID=61149 RepID=A0A2P2QPI7_RHIMU
MSILEALLLMTGEKMYLSGLVKFRLGAECNSCISTTFSFVTVSGRNEPSVFAHVKNETENRQESLLQIHQNPQENLLQIGM